MEAKNIEFNFAHVTFTESGIVELHFCRPKLEVQLSEVFEVFEVIKKELDGSKCYLMVSTVEGAKMSQEAREFASSDSFNDISRADAIVRTDYSHEMAANFFIRVNKPKRPVQLFPDRARAQKWLLFQDENRKEEE